MIDAGHLVNCGTYMDFKKATDELFDRTSHAALARLLGVSVASIRQARLSSSVKAYRAPPGGWEDAIAKLAEKRVAQLRRLIEKMRER